MNKINLKITPFWQESKISKANINILADISCQKDSVLFSIYKQVTNKKFIDLEGPFLIKDKIGNIDCISKTSSQMHVETESYLPKRATEGNIEISYTVVVNPVKKNPAFDFGYEDNGVTGSGMTFLPLFECDYCDFSIEWDLSKVPDDFTGVCSFGEGNCSVQGNPSIIQECFFCAGKIEKSSNENFGFYWLSNPDFNAAPVAEWTKKAYELISSFFKDTESSYRIFARKVQEDKFGGTALNNSYLFVYPPDKIPDISDIKFLFAHEMVHNWIKMHDNPFGSLTWYVEGMAEYYSVLILWQNGLISKEELVSELNKKSERYYQNPHISIKNEDAGKLLFSDRDATYVPYGRGFFYLADIDSKLLNKTNGKVCLDNIMYKLKDLFDSGKNPGSNEWLYEITPFLGEAARKEFDEMTNGKPINPNLKRFGSKLKYSKKAGHVRNTDKPCNRWVFK